jgi:hypothetical protein
MKSQIGYYVHHHGDGHRQRALAIARAAPGCFTLRGRTDDIAHLDLADDYGGRADPGSGIGTGESLHYAPHGQDGIRQRVAAISTWIADTKPGLFVVDVSVEVAMLARLTSTPMVYVRLSGSRRDAPHLDAFRAAVAIISPFHRDLDDTDVTPWVREKTIYLPGLSSAHTGAAAHTDTVLVVCGKGGGPFSGEDLSAAAAATPETTWRAIGPVTPPTTFPANLSIEGWVETADEEIAKSSVVIGHPGDGLVNAVIATQRPFICLPQPRPFDEQIAKARRLEALGVAVMIETWPSAAAWPALLQRAKSLDPGATNKLHDPDGAARAARLLKALAG